MEEVFELEKHALIFPPILVPILKYPNLHKIFSVVKLINRHLGELPKVIRLYHPYKVKPQPTGKFLLSSESTASYESPRKSQRVRPMIWGDALRFLTEVIPSVLDAL